MQRLGSWVVVAAVVAVVAAAAVDALRGGAPAPVVTQQGRESAGSASPRPSVVPGVDPELPAQLARARVSGSISYSSGCGTQSIDLPHLDSGGGMTILTPEACPPGPLFLREPSPSVRADGDDELLTRCDLPPENACRTFRIPQARLDALPERLGVDGADRRAVAVTDLAWFGDGRVALLLELRDTEPRQPRHPVTVLAIFDGDELVAARPSLRGTLTRLEPSPRGTYVTARPDVILDSGGGELPLPFAIGGDVLAIAWSPDERWTAFSSGRGIFLVRTTDLVRLRETGLRPGMIRLPILADDIAWTGDP